MDAGDIERQLGTSAIGDSPTITCNAGSCEEEFFLDERFVWLHNTSDVHRIVVADIRPVPALGGSVGQCRGYPP